MTYAIVLTCVDFRLHTIINDYFSNRRIEYYLFTLPGSSLGLVDENHIIWKQTFIDTFNIVKNIQKISYIYIIDHIDCQYYQSVYNNKNSFDKSLHFDNLTKLKNSTEFIDLFKNIPIIFCLLDENQNMLEYE